MLKVYSWFNDLLKCMIEHKPYPIDVINMCGSRASGKTNAVEEFVLNACDLGDENGFPISVSVIVFRKQANDIYEVFKQYQQDLNRFGIFPSVVFSKMVFEFDNTNSIRFKFIANRKNKKSLSGLSASKGEYVIVVKEEAYEFSDEDDAMIDQAVRGDNPNVKMLKINVCNPWFPRSSFLSFCIREFPFNEPVLKNIGYQIGTKVVESYGYKKRYLFCYTNGRAIRDVLPDGKIQSILETYTTDPQNAKTADIGVPGTCNGAVYGHLMNNIKPAVYQPHYFVAGGGDYACGASVGSGKTAFVFCAGDTFECIDVYGEFIWDKRKEGENDFIVAKNVVDFYIEQISEYTRNTGVVIDKGNPFYCRVDFSARGFIDVLNAEVYNRGIDGMWFECCSKVPIEDRFFVGKYKMSCNQLRINPACSNLLTEMEMLRYRDNPTQTKLTEGSDHSIDAFHYCIEPDMYNMLSNQDVDKLKGVISKRGMKKVG